MTDMPEWLAKELTADLEAMTPSAVRHPRHYNSHPSGVECITITKHMNFCRGNAMKYLWRAGLKGGPEKEIEDLEKSAEYLAIEINRLRAALPPSSTATAKDHIP